VHVHTYRRLHPRDVTERDGIPVTSVARTLVDLTDLLDAGELANLIHEAAFRGSFSALATRDAMARAHGRSPTQREDKLKQRLLEALGYTVLRFGAEEIGRSAIARLKRALAAQ